MDTLAEKTAVTEDVSNRQPYHAGNMDDHEIKTQRIVITMTMSFVRCVKYQSNTCQAAFIS